MHAAVMMRKSFFEKISMGYSFSQNREALSLVYICYFLILVFIFVVILLHTSGDQLIPITYRYHAFILFCFIELWFLYKRWISLASILILVVTPFFLLILPPLAGLFDDEFYFWFPYIPIGLSLIPHFTLHPVRQRITLIITLVIYMLISLLIDNFLIYMSDGHGKIIPIVMENRFYYNLIPVLLFIYVNLALGLLFAQNYRYELIMQKQQEHLVQAEKMASLGTLTSGIAHEINNPLNFISGSLHALNTLTEQYMKEEEEKPGEKKKILQQMEQVIDRSFEGVNRASDIISKLEFFANPGHEEKKEVNLDTLLYASLSRIESRLPYYIVLNKRIPRGLTVWCHEQQLQLVFSHILRNAIDALESKKDKNRERIEITASEKKIDGPWFTRISFRNSGPPIPEKDLKQIFDPFFSSRDPGEGIGLGMSLSYMIVRNHGGRIEVRNREGMVEFDVLLPVGIEGGTAQIRLIS
jgi:signal transduction histidine kinase